MTTTATLPRPRGGKLMNTVRLMRDPRTSYRTWLSERGDPVRVTAINGDIVLTGNPQGARDVFSADPSCFAPFATRALGPILGMASLLRLTGEAHKRERKLMRPPFHGARMKSQGERMAASVRRVFDRLEPGQEFIAHEAMLDVSLEIIARTVLGAGTDEETNALIEAIEDALDALHPLMMFHPGFQTAPLGLGPWGSFVRKRDRLRSMITVIIDRKRAQWSAGEPAGDDILSMLLEARYEDGAAMEDEALCDELLTLLIAGHETTAVSLTWALYWLHRQPETLTRLREELRAPEAPEAPADRAKIGYLRAVCQESLRLRPVVADVLREVVTPITVCGVEVPAGWCVGVSVVTIHEDPELYPEPEAFRPERFLERRYSAFEFMPFGGGHRRCIGAPFAMFEMAVVLDTLLSEYELELLEDEEPSEVRRNVTMGPSTGVRMRRKVEGR